MMETTKIIPEYPCIIFLSRKDYNMLMTMTAYTRNSFISLAFFVCVCMCVLGGGGDSEGQKGGESTNSYFKEGTVKGQCLIFSSFTTYI